MGRKNIHDVFWKPYLDDLINKNIPFIVNEATNNPSKKQFIRRYVRDNRDILRIRVNTPKEPIIGVYTNKSRVEMWKLLMKRGHIKKDTKYMWRFGKAILDGLIKHGVSGKKVIEGIDTKKKILNTRLTTHKIKENPDRTITITATLNIRLDDGRRFASTKKIKLRKKGGGVKNR